MLPPSEVYDRYGVGAGGLTSAQVAERFKEHGKNQLTPPKELPEWVKLLKQFLNPLMLLLIVAGGLCFLAYGLQNPKDRNNLILGAALIIVVALTCVMSYVQERSASNVMASLSKMMPNQCTVVRDGKEQKVSAVDLVPGDLVKLYIGDRVPADIRILETSDLKVECSSLTGESDLVPASVDKKHDNPAEARNIIFMSSLCMNGEGRGIVIRTGDKTFIGRIASLAAGTTNQRSTLQVEVHRLVVFISILAFSCAIILFVIGLARKMSAVNAFVNGFILVLVAFVPEGLPATVTSCLALTALRLKARNVLIKRTDIIENLGCATIIASDKTGTLTQNKMSVENVWCNTEFHTAARFIPALIINDQPLGRESRMHRIKGAIERASRSLAALSKTSSMNSPAQRQSTPVAAGAEPLASKSASVLAPLKTLAAVSKKVGLQAVSVPIELVLPRKDIHKGAASGKERLMDLQAKSSHGTGNGSPLGQVSVDIAKGSSGTPGGAQHNSSFSKASTSYKPARRQSFDYVARMSVGRKSIPVGDGTFEFEASTTRVSSVSEPSSTPVDQMMLQQFRDNSEVTWQGSTAFTKLITLATVCNRAKYAAAEPVEGEVAVQMFPASNQDRQILGDATDSGLLRYCDRLIPEHITRTAYTKVHEIPFNSANKWSLVVTECPGQLQQHLVMMKGAPEIVIKKCSSYLKEGKELAVDDSFTTSMMAAYERCGVMGERVIGFSYKVINARMPETYKEEGSGPPTDGLVFLGLLSLVDPHRPGVPEAVARVRGAGVRVAMVTGDHPLTAEAIARKVGIVQCATRREVAAERGVSESEVALEDDDVGAVVLTGAQIAAMTTDEEWNAVLVKEELVFARTTPQQKLEIVKHLQRLDEVVAVTGDGVNDSPALKAAQIGVAMGLGGSDVAREAADIVLLDDQFPSIVAAIEEGRVIYDNLKKTIAYTLTHTVPEVLPLFLNLALSFPPGLGGLLILSIDLLTEQGPAISLAYEPAESAVMDRPPRDLAVDRLINGTIIRYAYLVAGMIEAGICLVAFFTVFWWNNVPASDVAFALDHDHFQTPGDQNVPLSVDCFVNAAGTESCKYTFSGDQQENIYRQAQSAWYITLVLCQFWHIWLCKTRTVSIFKHGLHRNLVTWVGCCVSITTILIIVYVPFLQGIFMTANLVGIGWVPQLLFPLIMLPYTEITKWATRVVPQGWWATHMQW